MFFGGSKKTKMIEWAIETLGKEGSLIGTAYKEISYADAKSYALNGKCVVLPVPADFKKDYMEFTTSINNVKYEVRLQRTFEGNGSVLSARRA